MYHKTNFRQVYDRAQDEVPAQVEPILFNQESEVTETNISNIVFEKNGELFTHDLHAVCSPNHMRTQLIQDNVIKEKIITKSELIKVDSISNRTLAGGETLDFQKFCYRIATG